jgi:sugar phosphate isomerase/epimerase
VSDIALSTMWAIGRFQKLADFFQAGKELGFARFELNHGVDSTMLAGLPLSAPITSVHEPCPADISADTLKARGWLVSALDEEERRQGVAAVQRSIDLAYELGVGVVIVHPGRVDVDPSLEPRLIALRREGKAGGPEYVAARERLLAARAARAEAHMRSVRRSVLELAEHAVPRGVRLGLENRDHVFEIPLPDELDELLHLSGDADAVGYWHDVGHGQVLANLGFGSHEEWFQRFAGQMVGIHLHDVLDLEDHRAAGRGTVDWSMVARHLPAGILRTCEFRPSHSPEQVRAGLELLRHALNGAHPGPERRAHETGA